MAEDAPVLDDESGEERSAPDWRIWLGLGITAVWLLMQAYYIFDVVGFGKFVYDGPPSVGGFLEGAFAPLAFLWLVIGYFLQQKELANSTRAIHLQYREMRRTAEQAEVQTEAIAASEAHARRETFMRMMELVTDQLGAILGMLFISSQSQGQGGTYDSEAVSEMWARLGSGDPQVFGRQLMNAYFTAGGAGSQEARDIFWGTPIRTRHSENFLRHFQRLLDGARDCDPDGMLYDAILGSAHGRIYQYMTELKRLPPAA